MAITPGTLQQAAAIPVRLGQVCLISSRNGKRWVVPKGCLEPGKTASEIALQEAWEEAGLVGVLQPEPVGSYLYEKYGNTYHVIVFVMDVTRVAQDWPERGLRERNWVGPTGLFARIEDPGLLEVLRFALDKNYAAS